jgi:hypothetical protein
MLSFYAPIRYYPVGFYGWAAGPWADPVDYSWGWMGDPWYGFYGTYFRPWGVYRGPSWWLTDFMISSSLQGAFQAREEARPSDQPTESAEGSEPMSPEVKDEIAAEVTKQLGEAQAEAQAEAGSDGAQSPPSNDALPPSFTDRGPHLFVANDRLEVENTATGATCIIGEGDAVQLSGGLPPDGSAPQVLVRASMRSDCPVGSRVSIPLPDLVEMHNSMRETVETGLETLRAAQGKDNLPMLPEEAAGDPVPPAFAASMQADPDAARVIEQEARQADQVEQEVIVDAGLGNMPPPVSSPDGSVVPVRDKEKQLLATIQVGQSENQVIAILGAPVSTSFLGGVKKMYEYRSGKVIFTDGDVSDVQSSAGPGGQTQDDGTPPGMPPGGITEGLSESQVIAILGKPLHVSFLGGLKKMYEYRDRKIVFVDGNVSEVQ